jgi:hypothetical protein
VWDELLFEHPVERRRFEPRRDLRGHEHVRDAGGLFDVLSVEWLGERFQR